MPSKEIWLPVIQDNIYADWEKLAQLATDDNVYVTQMPGLGYKVHVPQAGTVSNVEINPSVYPLTVESRTDNTLDYTLDNIVVKPIHLEKFHKDTLTYDKMASIMIDHAGRIGEAQLYKSFINWYIGKSTGKFVETSGSTNANSTAPGSTQSCKKMLLADLRNAVEIMDAQKIPDDGQRFCALPSQMFYQLLGDLEAGTYNISLIEKDGLIMLQQPLYNVKIMKFPNVVNVITSTYASRAYQHAGGTTDRHAGLLFHRTAVSIAKGPFNVFGNYNDATYQGDVVSANAYMGGKYRRSDLKGVIPIVQKDA